jgi:hypothetical protein
MAETEVTEDQKAQVLRIMPLGVPFFTACVYAHLTLDQIAILEEDNSFQREIEYQQKAEEVRLMQVYKRATENAADYKYDYKGIRDRLELINPKAYSKKGSAKPEDPADTKVNVQIYIPDNGRDK